MQKDNYGTVGVTQEEVIEKLRSDPTFNIENLFVIDSEKYLLAQKDSYLEMPHIHSWDELSYEETISEYHKKLQNSWLMPEDYLQFDIESWILSKCKTSEEIERVNTELKLYHEFNLINLLKYLRYLRDVADKHKIVWGIGRGSSCSSFVLFLMGIHRVNSLYYQLSINEFLR